MKLALLAALCFCCGSALAMESIAVGPHSYYVKGSDGPVSAANRGFNSNAGFVVTPEGVVVFDALGTPALGKELLAEIRRRTQQPIRLLILSHYHADHIYGAEVFRAAGAKVWAQREGQGYLHSDLAQQRLDERRGVLKQAIGKGFKLPEPDRWLERDEEFGFGGVRFALRHVGPAHTPEDLVLLVQPDGVLFAGDLLFEGRIPFLGEAESRVWLTALDALQSGGVKQLVPGHGLAFADASASIDLTRRYLQDLRTKMREAVSQMETFDSAYAQADWSQWSKYPAFEAAHRGNAYTVYLEMERESLKH